MIHSLKRLLSIIAGSDGSTPTARDFLIYMGPNEVRWTNKIEHLFLMERSSDPSQPAEGECVIWMSDGTGKGDDGDIMIASTANSTTNYGTLFDHSGGAGW